MDLSVTNGLSAINNISFMPTTVDMPAKTNGKVFEDFFNAAVNLIDQTNAYQLKADQMQLDLATGRIDDMQSVLLAQDRAYSTLNFTVQVTNKIIESYREIMRMQV